MQSALAPRNLPSVDSLLQNLIFVFCSICWVCLATQQIRPSKIGIAQLFFQLTQSREFWLKTHFCHFYFIIIHHFFLSLIKLETLSKYHNAKCCYAECCSTQKFTVSWEFVAKFNFFILFHMMSLFSNTTNQTIQDWHRTTSFSN